MKPDLTICDWAFGIPREEEIMNPRYKRIQWHGLDPSLLVKSGSEDPAEIYKGKERFCNFLYSNKVAYRENFFRELSKYKKVDAPGRSMNNMAPIDARYSGNIWERKRQFLSSYKFTISFENYAYPGYQTEKLYDAMRATSIPIYCGDSHVGELFNAASFVNVRDYSSKKNIGVNLLERYSQMDFRDARPQYFNSPLQMIKRKLKTIGRNTKMNREFDKQDFGNVIDRIIELDRDPEKYIAMLRQPWLKNNLPPRNDDVVERWKKIFTLP